MARRSAIAALALLSTASAEPGTCVPCAAEEGPPAGEFPTSHNGIKWPTLCLTNKTGQDHFFTVGDWGGLGNYPPKTFDNTREKRPLVPELDTYAQMSVAKVMKSVAEQSKPQFILNVGDNFYPAGIETRCGAATMCSVIHTGQWTNSFEKVYDGPLNSIVWMGVLGNHDFGGWMFNAGWDQAIAYTWHSDRWLTPALYWERRVQYCDFSVDVFFFDTNIMDAFPPQANPEHNLCSMEHNTGTCGRISGPSDPHDCVKWFQQLDQEQKAWLEKRLAQSDADWQIVVTHFTPQYGTPFWTKIAAKYGVDLIVTGHRHQQEVHYKDDVIAGMGDTAWVVTGGGGGVTSEGNPKYEGPTMQQYGFLDITVSKENLVIDMWSFTGKKKSSTTVTPRSPGEYVEPPAPTPRPRAGGNVSSAAACSANPGCAKLHGNCCPNDEGVSLGCCSRRLEAAESLESGADQQPAASSQADHQERRLDAGCSASRRRGQGGWSSSASNRRRAIKNYASNCWTACGNRAGYCPTYCGDGNACCRLGEKGPVECEGVAFPAPGHHTCVQPVGNRLVMESEGPVLMQGVEASDMKVKYLDESVFKMQTDLVREDCLQGCGDKAGHCPYFCGAGRACCKKDTPSDPAECRTANVYGFVTDHYECVMVMDEGLTGQPSWGVASVVAVPNLASTVEKSAQASDVQTVAARGVSWWLLVLSAGCLAMAAVAGAALYSGHGKGKGKGTPRTRGIQMPAAEEDSVPLVEAAAAVEMAAGAAAPAGVPLLAAPQVVPVAPLVSGYVTSGYAVPSYQVAGYPVPSYPAPSYAVPVVQQRAVVEPVAVHQP